MDVWIKKCERQSICKYCEKPIIKGQYVVVGRFWIKPKSDQGTLQGAYRHKDYHWHMENDEGIHCWEEQGKQAIDKLPPKLSRAGRKPIDLTDEQRAKRYKIVNKRSSITYKIREELAKPSDAQDFDLIARLGENLHKLKEEIAQYGGVPDSW